MIHSTNFQCVGESTNTLEIRAGVVWNATCALILNMQINVTFSLPKGIYTHKSWKQLLLA